VQALSFLLENELEVSLAGFHAVVAVSELESILDLNPLRELAIVSHFLQT
jgi:hypothetical protein